MGGRLRFILMGAALIMILVFLSGFHRVQLFGFKADRVVVSLPFGTTPDAVGRAVGLDGRLYGPLTFATNGKTTVVADTYRQRVLLLSQGHITEVPTLGQLVEDVALTRDGQVVVADNRNNALWTLKQTRQHKLISFPSPPGYTEALWHIGIGERNRIYVELVRFGRGTFSERLDEYTDTGRFVRRLAEAQGGRSGGVIPLAGSLISDPVRDFQVAPDGDLYIEPATSGSHTATIRVYNPHGQFLRDVQVDAPSRIVNSDLLGVSQQGWLYLAVNVNIPHKAAVLVVGPSGVILAHWHVPAVRVYAAAYGRVLPSGSLYLDDTTAKSYQIREYVPAPRRVWRWTGF